MKVINGIANLNCESQRTVVTIGNFDGLHIGHQQLIKEAVSIANKSHAKSVVLTFDPHPLTVLKPEISFFQLFDRFDQSHILEKLGVDFFVVEKFTKEFSNLSPQEFLTELLFDPMKPMHIVVGYDFGFGKGKSGGLSDLKKFASERDCEVTIVEPVKVCGEIVSSSYIRKLLAAGDIAKANELLLHPYFIRGEVIQGDQRGRNIGFATANLQVDIVDRPKAGVYVTRTKIEDQYFNSVSNLGFRPTFKDGGDHCFLETHLFDFKNEIYGEAITVELLHFLREEKKFSSVDDLVEQIQKDCFDAEGFHREMVSRR